MLLSMATWPAFIMSKGEICLVFSAFVSDLLDCRRDQFLKEMAEPAIQTLFKLLCFADLLIWLWTHTEGRLNFNQTSLMHTVTWQMP